MLSLFKAGGRASLSFLLLERINISFCLFLNILIEPTMQWTVKKKQRMQLAVGSLVELGCDVLKVRTRSNFKRGTIYRKKKCKCSGLFHHICYFGILRITLLDLSFH